MPVPKKSLGITARVTLSIQVPIERGLEIDAIAKTMGISRHKLLRLAFDTGLPLVVAGAAPRPAADQHQA
jgi:hypothetical protein